MPDYKVVLTWESIYDVAEIAEYIEDKFSRQKADEFQRGIENEKTQIHHIRQGVQYLGFRFYLTENRKVIRLLRAQNKRKLRKRITEFGKMISNDQIDYMNLHNSLVNTRGHLLHGNTYNLRTRYFTELDNIIYTHDMEKADMQIAYLIETNNKPIQGGRA